MPQTWVITYLRHNVQRGQNRKPLPDNQ